MITPAHNVTKGSLRKKNWQKRFHRIENLFFFECFSHIYARGRINAWIINKNLYIILFVRNKLLYLGYIQSVTFYHPFLILYFSFMFGSLNLCINRFLDVTVDMRKKIIIHNGSIISCVDSLLTRSLNG